MTRQTFCHYSFLICIYTVGYISQRSQSSPSHTHSLIVSYFVSLYCSCNITTEETKTPNTTTPKGEMDVIVFFVYDYHVFNNHGVEIEICCEAQWGSQISGWTPKLLKLRALLAPKRKS
jgi:hypothetical protein